MSDPVDPLDDDITYLQTVEDAGATTVVVGIARGRAVRQYIVRGLDDSAVDAFDRDVNCALDRDEDPEATIACWATRQGE